MVRHLVYALIAITWAAMTGILVKREVLDKRAPGPEAGYAAVLTPDRRDYQSRMGIYLRGERWGTAELFFYYPPEPEVGYSIDQDITMEVPPSVPWLDGVGSTIARIHTTISVDAEMQPTSFTVTLESPLVSGRVEGRRAGQQMRVRSAIGNQVKEYAVDLPPTDVITPGLLPVLPVAHLRQGDRWSVVSFDPFTFRQIRAVVEVQGTEVIRIGRRVMNTKVLAISQSGTTLKAWVDSRGEILRAMGLFNIMLEKEDLPLEAEEPS